MLKLVAAFAAAGTILASWVGMTAATRTTECVKAAAADETTHLSASTSRIEPSATVPSVIFESERSPLRAKSVEALPPSPTDARLKHPFASASMSPAFPVATHPSQLTDPFGAPGTDRTIAVELAAGHLREPFGSTSTGHPSPTDSLPPRLADPFAREAASSTPVAPPQIRLLDPFARS